MKKYSIDELARMIDHTNLKADALDRDLEKLCAEAKAYNFAMVAINQIQSPTCAKLLEGTDIKVGAAIGFPLGQTSIETKVFETKNAFSLGANEIDYVIHIGQAREGNWDYIQREMEAIVELCRRKKVISKVIFENCYLTNEEKIKLCEIASIVKPDFIKTSTGMAKSGATVEDIALMKKHVAKDVQVKASGGVRTAEMFLDMLKAGATRVGTSSGIAILQDLRERFFSDEERYLEL